MAGLNEDYRNKLEAIDFEKIQPEKDCIIFPNTDFEPDWELAGDLD